MAYPWTAYKTWVTGEVLTASDLNSSFSTVITNAGPDTTNDYSANVTAMQSTADPYPAGTESLATTLAGELERLRYVIAQISGETQWYIDPDATIANIVGGTTTFAGAKTFSTAVTITPTTNQLVLGTTRTVTLTAPTPASASRTVTIPDLSADYSLIGTVGAQTITGAKTFASSALLLQEAGSTDVVTVAVASLGSGRTYTVPDAGGAADFVMTAGNQTLAGTKTFSSPIAASGITNTGGVDIEGSNTNDSASSGQVGEIVSGVIPFASRVSLTTATAANVTSISLTAGDWDITAAIGFVPGTNTNVTSMQGAISITSATLPANTAYSAPNSNGEMRIEKEYSAGLVLTGNFVHSIDMASYRISLTATTTFYLIARAVFTVSTLEACGFVQARRRR